MGTTLSSSSHFVAFELLQLRRQVTVIVVGCISISHHAYALLTRLTFEPIAFRVLPFTALPSGCPFGCSLRIFLPGRSVLQNTAVVHHLRSELLAAREHFWLCSFCVSPEVAQKDLRLLCFLPVLTQPFNERLAFFRG